MSQDDVHDHITKIYRSNETCLHFKKKKWSNYSENFVETYKFLQPGTKGALGAYLVYKFFESTGFKVIQQERGYCDIDIDGFNHEIKTSMNKSVKGYGIKHIKPSADFNNLIFLSIDPDEKFGLRFINRKHLYYFIDNGILTNSTRLNKEGYFNLKNGIRPSGYSEDYGVSGKKANIMLKSKYFKPINQWSIDLSNEPLVKRRTLFEVCKVLS